MVICLARCEPFKTFPHTKLLFSTTTDIGNNVLYGCDEGYVFVDNSIVNKLTCDPTQTWAGFIPVCKSKQAHIQSFN